jgi:hypothetical protein
MRRTDVPINTRDPRVGTENLASQEVTQTLSMRSVCLKSTLNSESASTVLSLRTAGLYVGRTVILIYFFLLQSIIHSSIHSFIYSAIHSFFLCFILLFATSISHTLSFSFFLYLLYYLFSTLHFY